MASTACVRTVGSCASVMRTACRGRHIPRVSGFAPLGVRMQPAPFCLSHQRTHPVAGLRAPGGAHSCSTRHRVIAQSFLGVGAPEALLVGVVALVVFGPKGLAEAAKSVGQTLRAFQPTIREVVEVSQDLKGTLEKELGLNEIREAARIPYVPPPSSLNSTSSRMAGTPRPSFDELVQQASGPAPTSGDAAAASTASSSMPAELEGGVPIPMTPAVVSNGETGSVAAGPGPSSNLAAALYDPDIEAKRRASAAAAWAASTPVTRETDAGEQQQQQQQQRVQQVGDMSVAELEAELARRRAAVNGTQGGSHAA